MNYVNISEIKRIIKQALAEDIGKGDITTRLLFPEDKKVEAVILACEEGVACGIGVTRLVFRLLSKSIKFIPKVKDADRIKKGQILVKIYGRLSSILSGERVALNLLGLLSGIATNTSQFVKKTKDCRVKIMDTRKTIPGLRELQKYAVRVGGGYNHRMDLYDGVLIKDNHIDSLHLLSGFPNLSKAVRRFKIKVPKKIIEIEVKNMREFRVAFEAMPDIIMLDNMRLEDIKKAVSLRDSLLQKNRRLPQLEVSGGITLRNVRQIAKSGVDMISIGALTHSVRSLDLSLEIKRIIF